MSPNSKISVVLTGPGAFIAPQGATFLDAIAEVMPLLRADFPFKGRGGIGDGLAPPVWVLPEYENPPSEECWPT